MNSRRTQCFCPAPFIDTMTTARWAVCGFCGGTCRNPFEDGPILAIDGRDPLDRAVDAAWDWVAEQPRLLGFMIAAAAGAAFWALALWLLRWLFASALTAGL